MSTLLSLQVSIICADFSASHISNALEVYEGKVSFNAEGPREEETDCFVGSVLTEATIIAIGLGVVADPPQAIPTGNNGNHNGQSGQNISTGGNG
jgi:hypothetical protein